MTPERFECVDRALAAAEGDLYVSASPADVHYLTGSEDGDAFVVYQPGLLPTLLIRASGYACAAASARAREVVPVGLADDGARLLADQIRQRRPGRAVAGPLGGTVVDALRTALPETTIVSRSRFGCDLRRAKTSDEIALLQRAADCVGAGVAACFAAVRAGATDREVAAAADAAARRAGADSVLFVQVKGGARSAYPDAEEVGRSFGSAEIGFIDLGVWHRCYRGDFCRPFVIGQPPTEALRLVETVDRIQEETLALLRPGLRCRDLYLTVCQMLADAGYPGAIPHHLGHGAGLLDDVVPRLVPTSEDELVEGEVVCVEPGVYRPGLGGARLEDTVVVRASGVQILSRAPRVGYV